MKRRIRGIVIFVVILCAWLRYIIWCFPGNMAFDTGSCIAWYLSIDRTNANNPLFQNWIFGLFYSLGPLIGIPAAGVALYCILQLIAEILLLTKITVFLSEIRTVRWTAWLPLFIYCIVPTFPVYAYTMAKDSNFALAVLLFEYYALQWVHDRGFLRKRVKIAGMAFSIVLMAILRNYAGFIPAFLFLVISLYSKEMAAKVASCLTLVIVLGLCIGLPSILGIPLADSRESMSLPLQTTAYYVRERPDDITEEEKAIIDDVIGYEEIVSLYDPMNADSIKNEARFDRRTCGEFLRMWFGMIWKHPDTIGRGFVESTWIYYTPEAVTDAKVHASYGISIRKSWREPLGLVLDQPNLKKAEKAVNSALTLPVIGTLSKIGIYSWLLVLMTILTLVFRKVRRYLICCIPLLMVLAGCLLSPINGYYRYAYSMILSIPVIFIPIVSELIHFPKEGDRW